MLLALDGRSMCSGFLAAGAAFDPVELRMAGLFWDVAAKGSHPETVSGCCAKPGAAGTSEDIGDS